MISFQKIRARVISHFIKESFIEFYFENGELIVKKILQRETRGDSVIKIIKKIKNKYPTVFPDGEDIFITFGDQSESRWFYRLYKNAFCTTMFNNENKHSFSLFPCP